MTWQTHNIVCQMQVNVNLTVRPVERTRYLTLVASVSWWDAINSRRYEPM